MSENHPTLHARNIRMTRSNLDLRLWARIAIVAIAATLLGTVIAGPWLGLLIVFAIAMSRRGQLLLFGPHAARSGWQNATSRGTEHAGVRTRGGRPNNTK
jgi:hypothetical protein